MPARTPAWKLQRARRPKGFYYQAVYGQGRGRRAFTLGYLTDEEAERAERHILTLGNPDRLVTTTWDREGVAPPPPTRAAITTAIKSWLLDRSAEILAEVLAEKAQAEATRLEAKGLYGDMTLRAFVERIYGPVRWTEHPKSEDREKWQWEQIYKHLGNVKMKNLNLHRWTMFLMAQKTWSPRSKQISQVVYRGALKYAAEIGAIPEPHPFRTIKGGNKRHTPPGEALSAEEVVLVLEGATSAMHRALFATAIGQGTRPSEVTSLDWGDVDWEGGRIRFRGGGKNLQAREWVPLTPLTRRELKQHWENEDQPEEGPVFLWRGKPFKSWIRSWKTAIKNAGIDPEGTRRLMPYSARYTYATLAAVAGVPRAAVRAGMRHSTSSRILETVYERLQDEQVANALEAFPSCE